MPVPQTTEAGRAAIMHGDDPRLQEVASAKLARKRAEARQAADALNARRADTTTPLVGRAPLETLPEPPAAEMELDAAPRTLVMSITILYRGRQITITSSGRTLDQFCDLLDKRLGAVS